MAFFIIDDRDPKITYTGTWNLGGTAHEHNGTVSSSIKVGNYFSVPFTGTSIGVYGTFDSSSAGVETSYEIDGGSMTTVTSRSSGLDSFQQLFGNPIPWGPELIFSTLVVTMVAVNKAAEAGEGTVWFDYFNVTHAGSASSSPPKKKSHAALIGGITAGVVVLIIAAGLLLLYFRRKRKRDSSLSVTSITPLPAASPAPMSESGPFLAASSGKHRPNPNSIGSETVSNTHTPAQSSYGPSESGTSRSQSRGPSSTADNTEHSTSVADLKRRQQQVVSSYEAGINGRNAHSAPIQHVDSGVRELTPAAAVSGPAELPPVYTAT
ncbi:hypothetical protein B0H13DRAFT_2107795 [Mycena leptocephala]|nr:hypothetical protein B0H13DRAFT_2107795 [Mycena leptocephala]